MNWIDLCYFPDLEAELAELDARLGVLAEGSRVSFDPDGLGIFDAMEQVVGLGFFRCQHYMVRRRGTAKKGAYFHGRSLRSYSYAMVINAGANYWKHVDEWGDEAALEPIQKPTLDVLLDAGVTQRDYRLSNLLWAIHPDQRLSRLLPHLIDWRDAFDRSRPATTQPVA